MDQKQSNTKSYSNKRSEKNGTSRKLQDKSTPKDKDVSNYNSSSFNKRKEDTRQNKKVAEKVMKGNIYA
ncbi:hypothetical protein TTHERM_00259630 (macronuclear) [Tetrahymena thermophila SB210]|uniref:Uncharacterized protein n=1 Tax=Tetrahymena thermophila (strain SB210) TaxID=312017 RepID=Q22UC3_TETTS|nr:hypothetical protein TTHERM_00259630 [Tetrahymena thermophila SB210]EAR88764.1 hypothetical protein TTHERM_00259630 [Tetrahymena thermophila SB210]|eukprot:XP_001009009.1 hypothetical protein TTHERM_00259630 [Tetrahymena thermophila SB210]